MGNIHMETVKSASPENLVYLLLGTLILGLSVLFIEKSRAFPDPATEAVVGCFANQLAYSDKYYRDNNPHIFHIFYLSPNLLVVFALYRIRTNKTTNKMSLILKV